MKKNSIILLVLFPLFTLTSSCALLPETLLRLVEEEPVAIPGRYTTSVLELVCTDLLHEAGMDMEFVPGEENPLDPSNIREIEFRHWGGAIDRINPADEEVQATWPYFSASFGSHQFLAGANEILVKVHFKDGAVPGTFKIAFLNFWATALITTEAGESHSVSTIYGSEGVSTGLLKCIQALEVVEFELTPQEGMFEFYVVFNKPAILRIFHRPTGFPYWTEQHGSSPDGITYDNRIPFLEEGVEYQISFEAEGWDGDAISWPEVATTLAVEQDPYMELHPDSPDGFQSSHGYFTTIRVILHNTSGVVHDFYHLEVDWVGVEPYGMPCDLPVPADIWLNGDVIVPEFIAYCGHSGVTFIDAIELSPGDHELEVSYWVYDVEGYGLRSRITQFTSYNTVTLQEHTWGPRPLDGGDLIW